MHDFQVLFDHGERSEILDPAMAVYGKLGFPTPPAARPWIYANFVQTVDGIVSLRGDAASGSDISQSAEDRWLMDLLRAHADAVIIGMGTLREETRMGRPRPRGPVFRIMDPGMQGLRAKLRRGRERNILVTAEGELKMSDYAVFDAEYVDVTILTTHEGASRMEPQRASHPKVDILAIDRGTAPGVERGVERKPERKPGIDMRKAVAALHERYGIKFLLCEGGPSLYSSMIVAGLIDEKFVTVAPIEVGQVSADGMRPTVLGDVGFSPEDAVRWSWLSCRKLGDYQFHRFRRKTGIC